jgi:hypothetical protein
MLVPVISQPAQSWELELIFEEEQPDRDPRTSKPRPFRSVASGRVSVLSIHSELVKDAIIHRR